MFSIANNNNIGQPTNNVTAISDTSTLNKRQNPPTQNVTPIIRSTNQLNTSTSSNTRVESNIVNVSVHIQPQQQHRTVPSSAMVC